MINNNYNNNSLVLHWPKMLDLCPPRRRWPRVVQRRISPHRRDFSYLLKIPPLIPKFFVFDYVKR